MWDGLQINCPKCLSEYMHDYYLKSEKYRARRKTPGRVRRIHLRRHYGLTPDDFEAMRSKQDGKCAICKEVPSPSGRLAREVFAHGLHVDHNQKTGRVRGLLCNNCNNGLGRFMDDPVRLRAALRYLRKHNIA